MLSPRGTSAAVFLPAMLLCAMLSAAGCQLADPTAGATLLTMSITDRAITANNVATTTIRAILRDDTDTDVGVTFTTNAGRFLSSSASEAKSVERETTNRVAEVALQADDRPALVVVTATAGRASAVDTLRFEPGPPDKLLLTANRTVAEANGNATISLTATLAMDNPLAKPTLGSVVLFTARDSSGALEPLLERRGTSQADGLVRVDVTSTVANVYTITASVEGGPTDTVTVEFGTN